MKRTDRTMSAGAGYLPGSVVVNGVSQPSFDPGVGFALADIPAGDSATVEYGITANNPKTNDTVTNSGALTYTVDDPLRGPVTATEPTNEITLALISTRISVVKSVDKAYAFRGDNLHYTSVITNGGNLSAVDPVFTDPIPAGTSFVPGSVRIDGVSYPAYQPGSGFPLPDLAAGQAVTVEFDVEVN